MSRLRSEGNDLSEPASSGVLSFASGDEDYPGVLEAMPFYSNVILSTLITPKE